jgi:hypothetical protein
MKKEKKIFQPLNNPWNEMYFYPKRAACMHPFLDQKPILSCPEN